VGQHQTVECEKCHVNNVFKGIPQTCAACHQKDDPHNGAFGTDCAQCHNPSDWKDAKFDHNLAAFKLTGAHVNVPCAKCHANGVFKGTPQACVSCHAEPQQHPGAFGIDCAQCHTTQTWQGATFDHVFPLNHGGAAALRARLATRRRTSQQYTATAATIMIRRAFKRSIWRKASAISRTACAATIAGRERAGSSSGLKRRACAIIFGVEVP
jgi:membrane-bound lytic murein transglycosylase